MAKSNKRVALFRAYEHLYAASQTVIGGASAFGYDADVIWGRFNWSEIQKKQLTAFDKLAKAMPARNLADWREATGETEEELHRRGGLTRQDLAALDAWRAERGLLEHLDPFVHLTGHRQYARWKPKKSPQHDIPWPNAPPGWAPRRWFVCQPPSWKLLQISVLQSRRMRAQLEAEFEAEVAFAEGRDEAPNHGLLLRQGPFRDVRFALQRPAHFYYRQWWTVEGTGETAKIVIHKPKASEPISEWRPARRRIWGRRFPLMHSLLPCSEPWTEGDALDRLALSAAFEAA